MEPEFSWTDYRAEVVRYLGLWWGNAEEAARFVAANEAAILADWQDDTDPADAAHCYADRDGHNVQTYGEEERKASMK